MIFLRYSVKSILSQSTEKVNQLQLLDFDKLVKSYPDRYRLRFTDRSSIDHVAVGVIGMLLLNFVLVRSTKLVIRAKRFQPSRNLVALLKDVRDLSANLP